MFGIEVYVGIAAVVLVVGLLIVFARRRSVKPVVEPTVLDNETTSAPEICVSPTGRDEKATMRGDKERDEKDQDEGAALFDLTMVKGIGPRYAERLKALGIDSVMALRDYDVTILAQTLGISEKTVADWVANANSLFDLTMVKGIGPRYAERLKALGIDSVMALRDYDVTILAQTLGISEKTVADWVANAKETFK